LLQRNHNYNFSSSQLFIFETGIKSYFSGEDKAREHQLIYGMLPEMLKHDLIVNDIYIDIGKVFMSAKNDSDTLAPASGKAKALLIFAEL
jgi:hypothetical protein